ncbi:hypothetical protein V3C99_009115 [Haemonchus contortus]|uniref:Secreted protein n=1 Tax=Haemonchus contortus TaxID=6289 RepID=A0A7I4YLX3_HAECO
MKFFIFILIVAASVHCHIPRPLDLGPETGWCIGSKETGGMCYNAFTGKTVYYGKGTDFWGQARNLLEVLKEFFSYTRFYLGPSHLDACSTSYRFEVKMHSK